MALPLVVGARDDRFSWSAATQRGQPAFAVNTFEAFLEPSSGLLHREHLSRIVPETWASAGGMLTRRPGCTADDPCREAWLHRVPWLPGLACRRAVVVPPRSPRDMGPRPSCERTASGGAGEASGASKTSEALGGRGKAATEDPASIGREAWDGYGQGAGSRWQAEAAV